ncbi:3-dehydroquinate dehydratase [Aggregatibacter actinomycetemcomitans]|uniref:type II 3-dehydroquinate dehydratase n=1 Tax=Aggregatibacter actinomycetemcomitans TaxID=714 RepID=UPI0001B9F54C|nr:type II 3-dehydroquinate dehydratase [Aggregatibacter actinomycetemcomitans]ACX83446.1 3-dehydroquinate dehydratase [Aggregatibacter actinomycetemcomitans D11S-1]KOE57443.1 3-dehydroquinate dehydratase [Aggregatibacter actinomycetemcomitans serotype c str. SCC2302]KOE59859.1 3-dehydroquinate dehydratase [Aggregatibacter actinomycetemcomitans serotype c str. AAS4A]KYK73963.1 3-dehydroquinate dehydratase [Aggregatibacter actinomycetemcomitans serotype e str. SA2149]KYK80742.1 3-dehydroquinate
MSSKHNILLLNGPNLNMLGVREPSHYGHLSLGMIEAKMHQLAGLQGVALTCFQANSEEKLIEQIHQSFQKVDFIIINPAAYTHTSVALRDALLAVAIPFVEVHLSNIHKREPFRHHSYFSDVAESVICGCGAQGYEFALQFALNYLAEKRNSAKIDEK